MERNTPATQVMATTISAVKALKINAALLPLRDLRRDLRLAELILSSLVWFVRWASAIYPHGKKIRISLFSRCSCNQVSTALICKVSLASGVNGRFG